ncbi:hypothetical protein K438DRAFT_1951085, partial [Mycena galopus ATCC 62051]
MVAPPRPSKLSISSTHLLQSAGVELKPHPLQNRFNSGRHWSQTFKASISPQISLATPAVRVAGPLTDHDDEDDISGGSGMLPWTGYVDWRDGEVGLVTIVVSHQDARYIVEMLVSITCAPIFVQYKMIFALLHQCWKIGLMIVSLTSDEILIEGSGKMFSEWDLAQALWDMIIFILKRFRWANLQRGDSMFQTSIPWILKLKTSRPQGFKTSRGLRSGSSPLRGAQGVPCRGGGGRARVLAPSKRWPPLRLIRGGRIAGRPGRLR